MAHRKTPPTLFEAYKRSFGPEGTDQRKQIPSVHATPMTELKKILGEPAERTSGYVFQGRGGPPPVPAPQIPAQRLSQLQSPPQPQAPAGRIERPAPKSGKATPGRAPSRRTPIVDTAPVILEMTRNAQAVLGATAFGLLAVFLGLGFVAGGGLSGRGTAATIENPNAGGDGGASAQSAGYGAGAGSARRAAPTAGATRVPPVSGVGPYSIRVITTKKDWAEAVKNALRDEHHIRDVFVKPERSNHVVYAGHFRSASDPAAVALQGRIREMTYAGMKYFKNAYPEKVE